MKLTTTACGDLRIGLEYGVEWLLLLSVTPDARADGFDPAARVGERTADETVRHDWSEWVEPELRQGFDSQLETLEAAVRAAKGLAFPKTGELVIPKCQFAIWYGALNQARLALEAKFGLADDPPEVGVPGQEARMGAYLRSQLYQSLQSYLLGMGLC